MFAIVKTLYGYERENEGWDMRVERTARVTVRYIYLCKKCGIYLWTKGDATQHGNWHKVKQKV